MRKIVFIVEGDSENEFVKRIVKPYFISHGVPDHYKEVL